MSGFLHSELLDNVVKANMERNDKEKRKKKQTGMSVRMANLGLSGTGSSCQH